MKHVRVTHYAKIEEIYMGQIHDIFFFFAEQAQIVLFPSCILQYFIILPVEMKLNYLLIYFA